MFKSRLSPFSDILLIPLALLAMVYINLFKQPAVRLALKVGLWKRPPLDEIRKKEVDIVSEKLAELKEFSSDDLQTVVATAFNHAYGLEPFGSKDKKIVNPKDDTGEIVNEDALKMMGFKASGGAGKATTAVVPLWPDELMDGALYNLTPNELEAVEEMPSNDFEEFGVDPTKDTDIKPGEGLEFDFSEFTFDDMLAKEEEEEDAQFDLKKVDFDLPAPDSDGDDSEAEEWPEELQF